MERPDKIHYYLDIATTVSERSTCLRRKYGAVIVKNDEIVSTGYNGAPRNRENCIKRNYCIRDTLKVNHNERCELCRAVHAEQNALLSASRNELLGSTLYLSCTENDDIVKDAECCNICKKLIINAGIEYVIIRDSKTEQRIYDVKEWNV